MNNNKLLDFLQGILGSYKKYVGKSGEEYYFICPLCARRDNAKKLAVNLNENNRDRYLHWHCWRESSHSGESLYSLLKKMNVQKDKFYELQSLLGHKKYKFDVETIEKDLFSDNDSVNEEKDANLPEHFHTFDIQSNSPEYRNALLYLKKRNITAHDIVKNNIGYCDHGKYSGYIVIPSYDENGKLNYYSGRSYYIDEGMGRHKNPMFSKNIIFNELHINWNEPIVIVEGIFDSLAVKRNAIPLLGKTISDALRMKVLEKKVKNIYICLDRDALMNSINAIEEFMKNDATVYFVELEDKDPSKIGFEQMVWKIKNAKPVDFTHLIQLKLSL